jgi:hypothetical protein
MEQLELVLKSAQNSGSDEPSGFLMFKPKYEKYTELSHSVFESEKDILRSEELLPPQPEIAEGEKAEEVKL